MKKFLYMAEGGRLNEIMANNAELVYRSISYFYLPSTKIIIIDSETFEAYIFSRKIDCNGNLQYIINEKTKEKIWG